ncbi:MAG: hypothetical protein HY203_08885 [Nitrospirae bacterium]|nr:hypothetical protein [Nitrospirota bacterium]
MREPDLKIIWEGSWPIGEYFALPYNQELDSGMGVYQIVTRPLGRNPIFIGKTYQQSFRKRLPQHSREELATWIEKNVSQPLFLKIGHIELFSWDRISAQIVDRTESLLIAAFDPPGNRAKTQTYSGGNFVIENLGSRRPLSRWVWAVHSGCGNYEIISK